MAVSTREAFNDVAAQPDGGFIATHPTAFQPPPKRVRQKARHFDLFSGPASGYVSRWIPGKGETELPGTRAGYPNGVLVSADGRYMYFNAWTAKEVHKYDLKAGKETGMVKLDFMPDNISWTSKRTMLAAGVKAPRGNCPAASSTLHPGIRHCGNRSRQNGGQDGVRFRRQGRAHWRRIRGAPGRQLDLYRGVPGRSNRQDPRQEVAEAAPVASACHSWEHL